MLLKRVSIIVGLLFAFLPAVAQKASDYRCSLFNEQLQKLSLSDSTLSLDLLLKAKDVGVYLSDRKVPKAKVTITSMVVTVLVIGEKITEFPISGNKITEGNSFYEELKLCNTGDRLAIDHIEYKTAAGETKRISKGYVLVLK